MQQFERSAAAHGSLRRLAIVVAIAAGLLVLIIPSCRTGMSTASITSTSPAAVAAAHRSAPGGGCADMAGTGDPSCRGGAATTTARADRSSAAAQTSSAQTSSAGSGLLALHSFAECSATATPGASVGSVPAPGTSMLACLAVLMMVLAAISWLRVHRSTGYAPPAALSAPLLIARYPRRATLAELCVLRT